MKRYPEPMAHGPESCEPSHMLWPMARRPVSRHTRAEAVDTGCQRDIPVLRPAESVKYPISTAMSNFVKSPPDVARSVHCIR